MTITLPSVLQRFFEVSNQHNIAFILSCFSNEAVVTDEDQIFRGRAEIEDWVVNAIDKYQFQLEPLDMKNEDPGIIAVVQMAGHFEGSPITLDYYFIIDDNEKISCLSID